MSTSESVVESPDRWVAGADGFRGGWVVVVWQPARGIVHCRAVESVDDVLTLPEGPEVIGVDMVIGCPDEAVPGGRVCDRQARALLGHPRGASVFSPPAYDALAADTYEGAQRLNRASGPEAPGISKQTFHLFPKMRALADQITSPRQVGVREVHPELAFYAMNDDEPLAESKHTDEGRMVRAQLVREAGIPDVGDAVAEVASGNIGPADVLDAHAACWTARRISEGVAERCPPRATSAPRNNRGLRMEIWR